MVWYKGWMPFDQRDRERMRQMKDGRALYEIDSSKYPLLSIRPQPFRRRETERLAIIEIQSGELKAVIRLMAKMNQMYLA